MTVGIRKILVGTDFSTRSDRALRRASLLAQTVSAELVLLHVIDNDQPKALLEVQERVATALLEAMSETVMKHDGLKCNHLLAFGERHKVINSVSEESATDIVVMGPHRRQVLKDVFTGTTVERTIRYSQTPVIVANALPASPYGRVLLTTDLSECSKRAIEKSLALGIGEMDEVLVVHAFDAPAQSTLRRTSATAHQLKRYFEQEEREAHGRLNDFLDTLELRPHKRILKLIDASAADSILKAAQECDAALIMVGTCGRSNLSRAVLGSVAEEVLRSSNLDVLVIPSRV